MSEPTIATVVTNPTNRPLRYTWLGKTGTYVQPQSSVTVPYDVYTAATLQQRRQLKTAIESKMVELQYLVCGVKTSKVDSIENRIVHGEAIKKAKAEAKVEPAVEATVTEPKTKRTQIINAVEEKEGESKLEAGEDLVQKAMGQETVTMRNAMGWKDPETDDPRTEQEVKDVDMESALTENVGDPLAKLAKEAEEKAAKEKREAELAEAKAKKKATAAKSANTKARTAAGEAAKEKAEADAAAEEAAAAKKRSEAAKKAAATRKKNQAKKAAKK